MELDELSQFNNAEIKQCLNLYDQLKNKNPDLAEKLKNSLINNASPDKNGNFSPTQLEAFKNIADSYKNNGQAYADNKDMDKALPQETAASEEFKNTCRNFWEKEAAANNMEYKENKDTPHFSAEVKTPNGKKVSFKASSGRNISLSCLDENGNPSVAPKPILTWLPNSFTTIRRQSCNSTLTALTNIRPECSSPAPKTVWNRLITRI